jgi:hypothetical protein
VWLLTKDPERGLRVVSFARRKGARAPTQSHIACEGNTGENRVRQVRDYLTDVQKSRFVGLSQDECLNLIYSIYDSPGCMCSERSGTDRCLSPDKSLRDSQY